MILTASNELQAEGFRSQLEARKDFLPSRTCFAVVPDEGGVQVEISEAPVCVNLYI